MKKRSITTDIFRLSQTDGSKQLFGVELLHGDFDDFFPYIISVLIKNEKGLENLCEIMEHEYEDIFHAVQTDTLNTYRDGLLFGSCGSRGMLYCMLSEDRDAEVIERACAFYDFFEIEDRFETEEEQQINRKIAALGKKLGKPVLLNR